MGIGAAALIVAVFFVISILTISLEAAFRNENEKNLKAGIKQGETNYEELKKSVQTFDIPKLEEPKKN